MLDFLVLCLAAYRLTHLVVFDRAFDFIRGMFVKRSFEINDGKVSAFYELQGGPFRRFIGKIINCYWCSGVWIGLLVTIGYKYVPNLIWLYMAFAVAAVASLIETVWTKSVGFPEMMEKKGEVSK